VRKTIRVRIKLQNMGVPGMRINSIRQHIIAIGPYVRL
jgi:hypothetical protein